MATAAFILAILATVFEGVLAIPILGGTIVIGTYYMALVFMFIIHGAILTLRILDKQDDKVAPIFGLVTSVVAFIPFVGFVMHIVTFILYVIDFAKRAGGKPTQA